ncbi:MAG: hypothetical protein KJ077_14850 [Anaerolineae bacterium]|nr:hypothetical protein [Anaerolineae bacterium]
MIIVVSELLVGLVFQIILGRIYPRAYISLAGDNQEALQLHKQFRANLIVSIEVKGERDDFLLTRTLRAGNATLPIIIISAAPIAEVEAKAAGASLFLSGPTIISDLEWEVPQLLPP